MMVMVNLIMMSAVVMVTMLIRAPENDLDHDSHDSHDGHNHDSHDSRNVGDDSDCGTISH